MNTKEQNEKKHYDVYLEVVLHVDAASAEDAQEEAYAEIKNLPSLRQSNCTYIYEFKN